MEERTARLEGINEQIRDRLTSIDRRFDAIDRRFDAIDRRFDSIDRRFGTIDRRFELIDRRFLWLSVVVGTWITTILTILFHH